jgi:AbrB family looped-hinge helix DNA binding protein
MERTAKITSKGQITVPIEVRRLLGVREGDELTFETSEAGVVVKAKRKIVDLSPWIGMDKTRGVNAINDTRLMRGHDELDEQIFEAWAKEHEQRS